MKTRLLITFLTIVIAVPIVTYVIIPFIGIQWWSSFDPRDSIEQTNTKLLENKKRVIVDGEMAEQICSITNGECPSYYIGNIQDDGSVMVGMTFSDTTKEKQFIFFIKNDTLSYEIKELEN